MKKSTKITLLLAICMICAGIVLTAIGLFTGAWPERIIEGGLWNHTFYSEKNYDNDYATSNTYSVSDVDIHNLEIDWTGGSISVIPYTGNDILIKETCSDEISENTCLRYKIDGNTLKVYESRNQASINFSEEDGMSEKDLTISIPSSVNESADFAITVNTVSADIALDNLRLAQLSVDTTSGNIHGKNMDISQIDCYSVAGDMNLQMRGGSSDSEINFDSTSGNCSLYIPAEGRVNADFDTTSGNYQNAFSSGHNNHDKDNYRENGQLYLLNVNTVSGNLLIDNCDQYDQ